MHTPSDYDKYILIWKDKKEEPASMNAIIQEVFVAPNKEFLNVSQLKLFCKKDNNSAPKTPKEAASVAVAMPEYIEPITAKIKAMTGINCPDFFIFSISEKFSLISGIFFLFIIDQTITYPIKIIAIITPGKIPAIKSFAIDSCTVTP